MDPKLQGIADNIQRATGLSDAEKDLLLQSIKEVDKAGSLSKFKLERLEHDKQTLSVMLEESIEDLQKKSRAIEAQNRELEIEAALERVRAVALSMMKPEGMLEVCKVISSQLEFLKVKDVRNVQTAIFYESKGIYVNYEFYAKHNKELITEVEYANHPVSQNFAEQMLKGPNQVWTYSFKGQEVKDWLNYQKGTNVFIDTYLENADTLNYYWYSLGPVGIGMSAYSPLQEQEIELFKRFRNVFELAYRRYLDIEKAEAQAREAIIEAALEKIRSTSLAMHRSDEIVNVVAVLFEKLKELGLIFDGGVAIVLSKEGSRDAVIGVVSPEKVVPSFHDLPYDEEAFADNPIALDEWKAKEEGVDVINKHYSFEEKNRYFEYVFKHNDESKIPRPLREFILKAGSYTATNIAEKNSLLIANSWTEQLFSEENIAVLRRVARVFEQAYVRFLDLQKAEAQAREAKIEAALEKVRSQANAMHRSEGLREVIKEVHNQLRHLKFRFDSADFLTDYTDQGYNIWLATTDPSIPSPIFVPYFDHRIFHLLKEEVGQGHDFFTFQLTQKEKDRYFKHVFETALAKYEHQESREFVLNAKGMATSCVVLRNIILSITNFASIPYTEEENNIIKRFAYVFEQSYIRFLDLKKAEAQARESQIELGLERVRARAMAMQRSDELKELIATVSEELGKLDFVLDRSFIHIIDQQTMGQTWWMSHPEAPDPVGLFLKYHEHKPYLALLDAWRERKLKFQYVLEGDTKKEWDKFLFAETELSQLPEIVIANMRSKEKVYLSSSFNNFGYLSVATLEPLSNDQFDVLLRFAKVFDLTYTRFNDLKQAEAQARESQIQLALERVRARTMAMQRSDELRDAAALLFQQAQALGAQSFACGFSIWGEEKKTATFWMAQESMIQPPFTANSTEDVFHEIYEAAQTGESLYVKVQEGMELEAHYRYMSTIPIFKGIMEKMEQAGRSVPTFQILHCAFFSQGFLLFITYEPVKEIWDVFERFAKVFEQTYTRFLDLQKAEAQARESQIEAGLERVRSRSMAMHKSEELSEVVAVVFQEKRKLGFNLTLCNIVLFDEKSLEADYWLSDNDQTIPPQAYRVPYFDHPLYQYQVNTWKNKLPYATFELAGKDKASWEETLKTKTDIGNLPESIWQIMMNIDRLFLSSVATKHGLLQVIASEHLSDELASILKRFAKVFEQTYTRFLDLQKAEAQSRESQIQLALERVRARTMAMQRSEELSEAVYMLFQQFRELGENPDQATIGVVNEDEHVIEYWVTMYGNQMDRVFKFSIDEPNVTNRIYKAWKKGDKSLVIDLSGKELYEFTTYRENMGGAKRNPEETRRVINVAFFSKGLLNVQSNQPPPDESIRLLERFALVFDQTYTRFIDLQKAEAQAREGQIQLALERVRARTMAMQKSDELADVAELLFKQVNDLGIKTWTTGFNVWSDDNNFYTDFVTNPQGGFMEPYTIDVTKTPVLIEISSAKKRGDEFLVTYEEGEALAETYRQLSKFGEKQFKSILEMGFEFPSHQYEHFVFGAKVSLMFITYDPMPEAHDIFKRFGKVFEQTYTRFLDLQKAEAQARESQIQLALERVRARTMAMHRSEELMDAANLLFQQVQSLGIPVWSCGYNIWEKGEKACTGWMSTNGAIQPSFRIPLTEHRTFIHMNESRLKAEAFYVEEMRGEELAEHYKYMFSLPDFKEMATKQVEEGFALPKSQINHVFNFKHGNLIFLSAQAIPDALDIFKRFTAVFEQTYTRFLDLQKAEAQTREAQIEAALEKVRSRSLAMHKSDELQEVVHTVFERLRELNVQVYTAIIIIFKEGSKDIVWWMQNKINQQYSRILIKYSGIPYLEDLFDAKEKSKELFSKCYVGEEKLKLYEYLFHHTDLKSVPEDQKKFLLENEFAAISIAFAKNTAIHLTSYSERSFSEEDHDILKRFAKVFDQAYTRFLDLQKAEAQAKEAQIEAGLERVRSKAMAMHKADDLNPAVAIVFEELDKLDLGMLRCGIGIIDKEKRHVGVWTTSASDEKNTVQVSGAESMDIHPLLRGAFDAWVKRTDFSYTLQGEDLFQYYSAVGETNIRLPQSQTEATTQYYYMASFDTGGLFAFRESEFYEEGKAVMKRFANVFNLTYKRFLDLQKAEAQAREAQIEAALEKIRSRSLAMHKSDELKEVIHSVFERLNDLDFELDTAAIIIFEEASKDTVWWLENIKDKQHSGVAVAYTDIHYFTKLFEAKQSGKEIISNFYNLEKKNEYLKYFFDHTDFRYTPEQQKEFLLSQKCVSMSVAIARNTAIHVVRYSERSFSEAQNEILKKFSKVFDQAYTRFLDLQKAEAQARESQIQLALERARAQSMIMQHSKELDDTLRVFHEQVLQLNIPSAFSFLWLPDEENQRHIFWAAWAENNSFKSKAINYPLDKNEPATAQCLIDWKSNAPVVAYHVPPAGVENYFAAWSELIAGVEQLKPEYFSDGLYYVEGFMKYGCFGVMVKHPLQEHENKILERFAIEFERAYTRFLDLQKAEAQTREAEIELALERVRARTMAMQKHDDLIGVINTLAEQLLQLGFDLQVANFSNGISDRDWDLWLFGMFDNGVSFTKRAVFPWFDHPFFHRVYAALDQYRKGGSDLSVEVFNKEEKDSWLDHTFSKTEFNDTPLELREGAYKAPGYCWSSIILKETWVAIGKYDTTPFTQEQNNILRKFATAFDQAYTRFLDLQKAEAQAREAKIEAALERVRASAMAMHQSEQLKEVANELRKQLGFLGQRELETCAIHLYDDSPDYFQSWAALLSPNEQGEVIQIRSQFPKRGVKIIEEMLECYARHKQDYVLMNEGAKAQEFLEMLKQKAPEVFEVVEKSMKEQIPELKRAYWSVADFAGGSLVMTTMIEPDENSRALLRRFANVFGLAYRRFVDLKKAEAQAKEAQIETALERVRSRTLAMQRSDELAETAAVVFQQLIHLGIEPNRLYINIVKDETGEAEFWITDEDGSKIAMAYSTNMNDNPSMKKMYEGWKAQNKSLIIDMHGKELDEYFKFLNSLNVPFKGGLSQKRRLQYIAYFGKGFIGMASPDEQPAETMQLLERFAAVFNLTFTRFNDLKIAEAHALKAEQDLVEIKAARKHAEDALVELQATQKQLVQSEKMASLGELTAGIAHEIQNPLNFVNNFSDVSNELLEEMKAELEKGNTKDAAAIVNDVKQNLQKILYHGRRADAIVKGMLQHSRNSSGQKELTDINALADEYLRLAYHGLRAKDKSFNAKFNTDFDKNVGKVNIIPQEIGRVILNLINNAFYAVNERQKACLPERQAESARFREVKQEVNPIPLTLPHNYEPTVSVSTKKVDDKVIITIADNGNGIPQKNLDKIFQPFFTTKPTGQGTGLGLSLAYDIITKGHNGDIKIETKEGEGSKFIVIIPSTQ